MARPAGIEDIIREVSLKTGINTEKLGKEYDVLYHMNQLHTLFGNKIIIFGGTALNLFYFKEKQRLSYDIDLKSSDVKNVRSRLKEECEELIESEIFHRFKTKDGVIIDLSKTYIKEKFAKLKASSIFDITGNTLLDVWFYVYPLEILFAEKILALTHRGTARDLYDAWVCTNLKYDEKYLLKSLIKRGNKRKVDPRIITTKYYHVDKDMSKVDSMIQNLNGKIMYEEVKNFINYLFFDKVKD